MKPMIMTAIALMVVGAAAFAYQGITYTSREKVVDLGPLQVTAEKTRTIPLLPIMGGMAIAGGVALLLAARRKS